MSTADDTIASLRNNGEKIIVIGSVMLVLTVCSIALRFLAKASNPKAFGLDDFFIGCCLLSYITSESLILRAVDVGRHAVDELSPEYSMFKRLTWGYSFLYWSNIAFATLSILSLYRRAFYIHRCFTWVSLTLVGLTVAWWVSGSIADAVSYIPTASWWDPSIAGGFVFDYNKFWLGTMVAELIIEAVVLAMPIGEVAKLILDVKKKLLVMAMFLMGCFVIVTGIIRIYFVRANLSEGDLTPGTIWLSVHTSVAIISASLPTYKPLVTRAIRSRSAGSGDRSHRSQGSSSNPLQTPRHPSTSTKRASATTTTMPHHRANMNMPGSPEDKENSITLVQTNETTYMFGPSYADPEKGLEQQVTDDVVVDEEVRETDVDDAMREHGVPTLVADIAEEEEEDEDAHARDAPVALVHQTSRQSTLDQSGSGRDAQDKT